MDIKDVLEKIAKPARSNKDGFYETDKLQEIENLLNEQGSEFHLIEKTNHTWIFGKKEPSEGENVLMVSTHADIVSSIKNPSSALDEEKKYFKGTYDNLGTNGACASLMINEDLPDNVYFAFNSDEETGRCLGANDALIYIKDKVKKEPIILALDVTDEGYENNRLFTVEGLHGVNEFSRRKMLEIFMSTEGNSQSFEVVRLRKKDDNSFLPESYQSEELTVYDESVFYANHNCNSCSLCIPGDGEMHGDSGFYIKEPVMRGYEVSLLTNIYAFTNYNLDKINELKAKKDAYVEEAKGIEEIDLRPKYTYVSSYTGGGNGGIGSYDYRGFRERYGNGYESPEERYGEGEEWTDEYFRYESAIEEAYEMSEDYGVEDFDIFYQDITEMYGLECSESLEAELKSIFDEIKELQSLYEDEMYDDEDKEQDWETAVYNRSFSKGYFRDDDEEVNNYDIDME